MKPINILPGKHSGVHNLLPNMRRQGGLDEDAMKPGIEIQTAKQGQQIGFRSALRQHVGFGKNSQLRAGLFLAPHVNFGGWILAYPDEGQTGLYTAGFQSLNALPQFCQQLARNGATVNEIGCGHYSGTTWMRWRVMSGVLPHRSSIDSSPVTIMRIPL